MEVEKQKPLLCAAICLVVVGAVVYFLVMKRHKESFTRTPISGCDNCQFVRSPVDYMMNPQKNPHHKANPADFKQPLEDNPIDMYAEERKLWSPSTLFQSMGNNWIDGTKTPFIMNDNKTRTLLRETGDETLRRVLDNSPVAIVTNAGLPPLQTDADVMEGDRYPQNHPRYGGPSFFTQDMTGS